MYGVRSLSLLPFVRSSLLQCRLSPRANQFLRKLSVTYSQKSDSKGVTEIKPDEDEKSKEKPGPTSHDTGSKMVRVQYIDKKSLVWDKRYKSVEDVPEMLPFQTIVQARNRFRIRVNLFMIGLTVLAALIVIYTGKERAKAGDSVEKRTIERHRQLRLQKAEEERTAQAAAADAGAEK